MRGAYFTRELPEPEASIVEVGDGRTYLVLSFQIAPCSFRTIVLEQQTKPECWVSRRIVNHRADPEASVTGLLLGPQEADLVGDLRRSLAIERRANWDLRHEIDRLKNQAKTAAGAAGERGRKRGRRNP